MMLTPHLQKLERTARENDLLLIYSGIFTDSMTDMIIDLAESYINSREKISKLRKKVSYLIAECFQNVVRHGIEGREDISQASGRGSFILRFAHHRCYIISENPLENEKIGDLKNRLDHLNARDQEELKQLYKEILANEVISEKGGAGLGLVDMARKTDRPIEYRFEKLNADIARFVMMLVLESPELEGSDVTHMEDLQAGIRMIDEAHAANQFLFFHGGFDQEIVVPMVSMIEQNLDNRLDQNSLRFQLFHSAVELMQNISQHGLIENESRTGTISVGTRKQGYYVTSSNPVSPESAAYLQPFFENLKLKNTAELDAMYKERLRTKMKSDEASAGLGMIDLARICKSWDFKLTKSGNGNDLFLYNIEL